MDFGWWDEWMRKGKYMTHIKCCIQVGLQVSMIKAWTMYVHVYMYICMYVCGMCSCIYSCMLGFHVCCGIFVHMCVHVYVIRACGILLCLCVYVS